MKKYRPLNGYILQYCPEHPRAIRSGGEKGYVYEHVLVAEKTIKRRLLPDEEVHHLDLNRSNNSPDNLVVLSSEAHVKLHAWLRRGAPVACFKSTLKKKAKPYVLGSFVYAEKKNRCANEKCDSPIRSSLKFCSPKCSTNSTQTVLSDSDLRKLKRMIRKNESWVKIGKEFNKSDNGMRKIARRYGFID